MGTRYPTTLLSWGVGIVSLLLFHSWGFDGRELSVHESLGVFVRYQMPALMVASGVIALLPWDSDYYLGVGTELGVVRMVLAATLVGVAAGMVCVSWWLLVALMWPLRLLRRGKRYGIPSCAARSKLTDGEQEARGYRRATGHGCIHGHRASAHIPVRAVAGRLPRMLDYPTVQLQCDFSTQAVPGFCADGGKYTYARTGPG